MLLYFYKEKKSLISFELQVSIFLKEQIVILLSHTDLKVFIFLKEQLLKGFPLTGSHPFVSFLLASTESFDPREHVHSWVPVDFPNLGLHYCS